MTDFSEKRRYPRVEGNFGLDLQTEDGLVAAEMINLSRNGACCRLKKEIPEMSSLEIAFTLPRCSRDFPSETVTCKGIVVRSEKGEVDGNGEPVYRVAVFFHEIEPEALEKISRFVDFCLQAHQN